VVLAQDKHVVVNIAGMKVGNPPDDFESGRTGQGGPGQWRVVSDSGATGRQAIEQTSTDATSFRFPLAIYKPLSARNVDVSVRFKPISGKVDQAGGIAVRLTSPDNYYIVRANALENNVRFYHVLKGKRTELKSADVKVASGQWQSLGLKTEGDRFTVTFNGTVLYTVVDRAIGDAGKVALWTKADSVTRFDDVKINALP
jgi:hypothetical protein